MSLPDFRMAIGLNSAWRTQPLFVKSRASSQSARNGLRYESRIGKELQRFVAAKTFSNLEHTPWFGFSDTYGTASCSPDYLLWFEGRAIIVEVKLTWVEVAKHKLDELYCPVVSLALQCPVLPLVICKYLNPQAPKAELSLQRALTSSAKLLHWPQIERMKW